MMLIISALLAAAALVHILSALMLDRSLQYLEVPYSSPKIPQEMDGYRIAFITDTHALPAEELREAVDKLNTYDLGLLLLGGDFPSLGEAPKRSMEILSHVRTRDGIYGVEGNHDKFTALFAAMEEYGIHPLSNSGAAIRKGFYVCGVEDLWNRSPDIAKAAEGAGENDFVLMVSHNPDVTMRQDTTMVDLVLSGHTHGGHITAFGVWAPALWPVKSITGYGQRFMSGFAKSRDGTDVYVSNGAGSFAYIPRVFARPQIILLTLKTGS